MPAAKRLFAVMHWASSANGTVVTECETPPPGLAFTTALKIINNHIPPPHDTVCSLPTRSTICYPYRVGAAPAPRKKQAAPLPGRAVVTKRARPNTGAPKTGPAAVTAPPPANDDRKPTTGQKPVIVSAGKPAKLRGEPMSVSVSPAEDDRSAAAPSAIVSATSRKHRRGPDASHGASAVPQAGDDYKRLKAAMTRRLRGE
jgi:hypothetical protein